MIILSQLLNLWAYLGFNLAVLLTNLQEHMPNDPRLSRFCENASSFLEYFEPTLGRIEILGGAGRIERVYFEINPDHKEQWEKPQIKVWDTLSKKIHNNWFLIQSVDYVRC